MPARSFRARSLCAAIVLGVVALTSCGGAAESEQRAPVGDASAPLQGRPSVKGTGDNGSKPAPPEAEHATGPTTRVAEGLTVQQAKAAAPCTLVTRAEAQRIFGRAAVRPLEAPQGPTCIFRTAARGGFVTLALQAIDYEEATAAMSERRKVKVLRRSGVCGLHGQSLLYVPVGEGRVLSVSGPCDIAMRFAAKALPRIAD